MNRIELHDAFVPQGCADMQAGRPAVTVEAGAMWVDAYTAVTTENGRYVQGGGCMTVGVAGLVQSGGFGSFSKRFGTASGNLLEAEVVTADGKVHVVNACREPELFWAIKGGGGGSIGVVTRLTLLTHELPDTFGAVFGAIEADSDQAFRELIGQTMRFYRDALFNPHWGEQLKFHGGNMLHLSMVFQGLSQQEAEQVWAPFFAWIKARPAYRFKEEARVIALPARHFWDAEFFRQHAPQLIVSDSRPDAPRNHVLWAGDEGQVGQFIHGYRSGWLPQSLLDERQLDALADAMFEATRHWGYSLHFNKGLAGGPADAIARSRDTAMNPGAMEAFALAITGSEGDPAFPGMPGASPDLEAGPARGCPHRSVDGRPAQTGPRRRFLRLGEQLLRARLAAFVLGRQLPAAGRRQTALRPGRTVLRASRRGQRGLERRRLQPPPLSATIHASARTQQGPLRHPWSILRACLPPLGRPRRFRGRPGISRKAVQMAESA